jgi:hypothetical protein
MSKFEIEARPGDALATIPLQFINADITVPRDGLSKQDIEELQSLCQPCPLFNKECSGFDDGEFDESSIGALVKPAHPLTHDEFKRNLEQANCHPNLRVRNWK